MDIILFLLVLLVICIYIQMRKILKIKRALVQSNEKLLRLNEKLNTMNNQLNEQNNQLSETNNIKEHYIAEFFDVCFSYISKMEKYQNMLYKIAINKIYDFFRKSFSRSLRRFIQAVKTAQPYVFQTFTLTTIFCTLLAIFSTEQLGLCNSHGKKIAKSPEFNTAQFFSCGSA